MSLFGQIFSFFRRKAIPSAIEDELEERRLHPRINPKEATRILVIDDSPTILTAMKRFIESAHCVFLGAIDAKMGMEVALTQKPDMIFLDIVMPGINGFAALRALRKNARTQDIPIVMMSGNEQAKAQFFGAHIGADDFMKKPFSRFEVFAHIARLLDADCVPRRPPLELPYNSPPVTPEAAPVQATPRRDEAPAHAERPPDPEKYAVSPEKAARASTAPKAPTEKAAALKASAVAARKASASPPKATARKAAAPQPKPKPPAANAAPATGVHPRSPVAPVQAGPAPETAQPLASSAQVVSIAPASPPAAPVVAPELLSRIARLAQLAQTDPEALKTLVVLSSQLCAQFIAARAEQVPAETAPRPRATAAAT